MQVVHFAPALRSGPALIGLLALALLGCPKRPPEVEPAPELPTRPVLVRTFAELGPDQYAELRTDPPLAAVPLDVVVSRHDVWRWTSTHTVWGTLPVIEFRDTDHPLASLQPTAGWYLGQPAKDGQDTVAAALVRDFADAPEGTDPQELVLGLGERWPLPWTLCQPLDPKRSDELVVHDPVRGIKLGLRSVATDGGSAAWTVDHVEYLSAGLPLSTWLESKDPGGCEELGTLVEGGKYRPARRSGE